MPSSVGPRLNDETNLAQGKTADSTSPLSAWFLKPLVFTVYLFDLLSPKPLAIPNSHMVCTLYLHRHR